MSCVQAVAIEGSHSLHTSRKVCVPPAIYKSVSDIRQGSGQFVGVFRQTYRYAEVVVQVG
jgi:hypothetical protein